MVSGACLLVGPVVQLDAPVAIAVGATRLASPVGVLRFASGDQAKLFIGQLASSSRDVVDKRAKRSVNVFLFLHNKAPF
jgi:hypothetical protein